jgi:hypothetical protein
MSPGKPWHFLREEVGPKGRAAHKGTVKLHLDSEVFPLHVLKTDEGHMQLIMEL